MTHSSARALGAPTSFGSTAAGGFAPAALVPHDASDNLGMTRMTLFDMVLAALRLSKKHGRRTAREPQPDREAKPRPRKPAALRLSRKHGRRAARERQPDREAKPSPRQLQRPVAPALGGWLAGLGAFTVLSVERLFATPHAAFVYARVAAYTSAVTVAALTVVLTAVFALGCGAMLWWLDDPVDRRRMAACTGRSFWTVTVYTWIALGLLVVDPPVAIDVAGLARPEVAEAQMGDVLAFRWLNQMRFAVVAAFAIAMVYLLQRTVRIANAVIAVGFGVGLVAALMTALGLLGGSGDY